MAVIFTHLKIVMYIEVPAEIIYGIMLRIFLQIV